MSTAKMVRGFFGKHAFRYILGLIGVVTSIYCNTILPKYLGYAIDFLTVSDMPGVMRVAIEFLIITLVSFAAMFIWRLLIYGFCRKTEFFLRENLLIKLQSLSSDFYAANNTGDLINRAISDVNSIRFMLGFGIVRSVDLILTVIFSAINMSDSVNPGMAAMALVPVPLLVFLIIRVRIVVRERFLKVQEAGSNISSKVQENVTGIRVIKAFSQERSEEEGFTRLSEEKTNAQMKLMRAFAVMGPSIQIAFGLVFSVFLVLGGSMAAKGTISLGEFVAFNSYLVYLAGPMGNINWVVRIFQQGIASMHRLDDIFLAVPSVDDSGADMTIEHVDSGSIELRNLSFSYKPGDRPELRDISFSVQPGSAVAIMGPTGCGKSTITGLLAKVWPCESGMIFIGGRDINEIPLGVLRESCAYVTQESFLFSDTIMENIRFFDETISDERVLAAAEAADVHEDIMSFPDGYNTVVGERGATLSGGQKQRITLARALVREPAILLLDDCLSAVDAATEKRIIENLRVKIAGCSTIIITHRPQTAALADRIITLTEDGCIEGEADIIG